MISKIIKHCEKRNPFGGALIALNTIRKIKLPELINKHLGTRSKQAKYSYADVVISWIMCTLCGAGRLDDVEKVRHAFKGTKSFKLPSHDNIGRVLKSLSTKTVKYQNNDIKHEFNMHDPLNDLMLDIALKTGLLNKSVPYVLDYDNVIIDCKKYDSTKTYEKNAHGYQPGVHFIGLIPVGIENRNGNSPAVYKLPETVTRTLDALHEKGITIDKFRSDAAAYQKELMRTLSERDIRFYIRYRSNAEFKDSLKYGSFHWKKMFIGNQEYEVTSAIQSEIQFNDSSYRVVITRYAKKSGGYAYRGIITNDLVMENEDVIYFYNMRGAIERNFDDLKNQWSWSRLPFSFLSENTVFLLVSAIGYIVYQYLIRKFSKKVDFLKKTWRLKRFIFAFIVCPTIWVGKGERVLKMDTDRDYAPLIE